MCGRYTVSQPSRVLEQILGGNEHPGMAARYNVAPSQKAPVVLATKDGRRRLAEMEWGLVPFLAKGSAVSQRIINARSETASEKPIFRDALLQRRCVVPADGFYEWQKMPGGIQPYLLRLTEGEPFGFAGLWDRWTGPRERVLDTFVILTTAANTLVASIHGRMPVILNSEQRAEWLAPRAELSALRLLCESYSASAMEMFPVGNCVNSPLFDTMECLQPVRLQSPGNLF